jgi:hypothetical protein
VTSCRQALFLVLVEATPRIQDPRVVGPPVGNDSQTLMGIVVQSLGWLSRVVVSGVGRVVGETEVRIQEVANGRSGHWQEGEPQESLDTR